MRARWAGVLVAITPAACGSPAPDDRATRAADPPRSAQSFDGRHVDAVRGVSARIPSNWRVSSTVLTPSLSAPREILSTGTAAMPVDPTGNMPYRALGRLGPRDAFLSVQEWPAATAHRGTDATTTARFRARPEHFRFRTEAAGQLEGTPHAGVDYWWRDFRGGDREFYLLVGIGRRASAETRRQAERLANSLAFLPGRTFGSGPWWVRVPAGWRVAVQQDTSTTKRLELFAETGAGLRLSLVLATPNGFGGPERVLPVRVSATDLSQLPTRLERSAGFGSDGRVDVALSSDEPVKDSDVPSLVELVNGILATLRVAVD